MSNIYSFLYGIDLPLVKKVECESPAISTIKHYYDYFSPVLGIFFAA